MLKQLKWRGISSEHTEFNDSEDRCPKPTMVSEEDSTDIYNNLQK